jgi:hypothetical protein
LLDYGSKGKGYPYGKPKNYQGEKKMFVMACLITALMLIVYGIMGCKKGHSFGYAVKDFFNSFF